MPSVKISGPFLVARKIMCVMQVYYQYLFSMYVCIGLILEVHEFSAVSFTPRTYKMATKNEK